MQDEIRKCAVCGKELTSRQQIYCSGYCREIAWSKKRKERYYRKKQENSEAFQKYMERNKQLTIARNRANRKTQCYKYAKKIMALSSLDEVAKFLDKNCRFKHGG